MPKHDPEVKYGGGSTRVPLERVENEKKKFRFDVEEVDRYNDDGWRKI